MDRFERAFGDTQRTAASTLRSVKGLTEQAKQLEKAAREGNIHNLKRAQSKLATALTALAQEVDNAIKAWPFQDEEEERYLRDGYAAELRDAAAEHGLVIREHEGSLVAHPSMVRILPRERAVRIDRRKVSAIRPSHLTDLLLKNQGKASAYSPTAFLESLFTVYSEITREGTSRHLMKVDGRVVPLERVYRLLTSLPRSSQEYDRTDFARDLYLLEKNGPVTTKSGATVSFPASTGTKSGRGLFTFVGADGHSLIYYGISFRGG